MYGVVIIEKDLHQVNESFENFDDNQMLYLRDKNNNVVGSLGISGDTSDNDEIAAVSGIESVGYKADIG